MKPVKRLLQTFKRTCICALQRQDGWSSQRNVTSQYQERSCKFQFYSRAIEITIEKITTRSNSNKFIQNNLIYEVHNLIYKIYQYEW